MIDRITPKNYKATAQTGPGHTMRHANPIPNGPNRGERVCGPAGAKEQQP
jgi:hypothetical protein